jgi:hypothetical protein
VTAFPDLIRPAADFKRFARATSLRIEEIVTLSWPQVD